MTLPRVSSATLELIKFAMVGGLNTLVGFVVFSSAIYVTDGKIALSLVANIVVGILFNFFSYGYAVFRSWGINQFAKFTLAYAFLYLVNYAVIYLMTMRGLNIYAAQFINLFYLAPISYLLLSRWVFSRNSNISQ